jgi:hypothetical protein
MLANLLILAFVMFMAYWWGHQGLFSGFLHMILTIAAGALAFALWEPVQANLFATWTPANAWGVALLLNFVVILGVFRGVMDKMVKGNVQFNLLINMIGGGICGLIAGMISAGIVVIGVGFMDIGPALGGYQPLLIDAKGKVVDNPQSSMWLGVNYQAASVMERLSTGAFSNSTPLRHLRPQVARASTLYRLHLDPNASVAITPPAVKLERWFVQEAPLRNVEDSVVRLLGDEARKAGHQAVFIETVWNNGGGGIYDSDGTLRIASPQIRLLTEPRDDSWRSPRALHPPLGFSQASGDVRQYVPFDNDVTFAVANASNVTFAWMFLIPSDQKPKAILVRNMRITLTGEPTEDADAIRAAVGTPPGAPVDESPVAAATTTPPPGTGTVGEREGIRTGSLALDVTISNMLPGVISKNLSTGLTIDGSTIKSGEATVRPSEVKISPTTAADRIDLPGHRAMVRLQIAKDQAQSLLGASRVAAASLQSVWLVDNSRNQWQPVAYVWLKSNGEQEIRVDLAVPITSARQLPVAKMSDGDKLYLYFLVNKNSSITEYNVGQTKQSIDLKIPG